MEFFVEADDNDVSFKDGDVIRNVIGQKWKAPSDLDQSNEATLKKSRKGAEWIALDTKENVTSDNYWLGP